jgi:hypothetical protein
MQARVMYDNANIVDAGLLVPAWGTVVSAC